MSIQKRPSRYVTMFLLLITCILLTNDGSGIGIINYGDPEISVTATKEASSPASTGFEYEWHNKDAFRPELRLGSIKKKVVYNLKVRTVQYVSGAATCTIQATAEGSLNSTPSISLPKKTGTSSGIVAVQGAAWATTKGKFSTLSPGTWTLTGTGTGTVTVGGGLAPGATGVTTTVNGKATITIRDGNTLPDIVSMCGNHYCISYDEGWPVPSPSHHWDGEKYTCGTYCPNEACGVLVPEAEYHKRNCGVTGCQLWDWTCPGAATSHSVHHFRGGVNSNDDIAEEEDDETGTTTNPNTVTCEACGEDYDPDNPGRHIASSCGQTGPNGESCINDYYDCTGAQHQHSW